MTEAERKLQESLKEHSPESPRVRESGSPRVPHANGSTPTLAAGGSRLWRVLYLYACRLKAKEQKELSGYKGSMHQ